MKSLELRRFLVAITPLFRQKSFCYTPSAPPWQASPKASLQRKRMQRGGLNSRKENEIARGRPAIDDALGSACLATSLLRFLTSSLLQ